MFLFPEVIDEGEDTRLGSTWCSCLERSDLSAVRHREEGNRGGVSLPISQVVVWQLLQLLLVPALANAVPTEAAFLLS